MRRFCIAMTLAVGIAATQPVHAESPQDVIAQHNAAWSGGDFDAFMATFADDAVLIYDGVELRGLDAIAEVYASDFGPNAPRNVILRQGRGSGGSIIREETYVFPDGSEECCTVSAIFVEAGQVSRVIVSNRGG